MVRRPAGRVRWTLRHVDAVLDRLPVAAALFAVPQFLAQLAAVRRTGDTAGVSWAWAALTCVSNAGWFVYFTLSQYWTALVPAISATVLAGALAVLLNPLRGQPDRAATAAAGWAAVLALAASDQVGRRA